MAAALGLVVVAIAVKVVASIIAARISRLRPADGLLLGVLLNTRGLTELVVLNIGWSAGIISDYQFPLFVVMAIATTALTVPLLDAISVGRARRGWWAIPALDHEDPPPEPS